MFELLSALAAASYLIAARVGLPISPVLGTALACALGALTLGAFSMCLSLYLPRLPTMMLSFAAVGVITFANLLGVTHYDSGGWLAAINHYGPPLATSLAAPLQSWLPPEYVKLETNSLLLRMLLWSAIALFQLRLEFRRMEIRG